MMSPWGEKDLLTLFTLWMSWAGIARSVDGLSRTSHPSACSFLTASTEISSLFALRCGLGFQALINSIEPLRPPFLILNHFSIDKSCRGKFSPVQCVDMLSLQVVHWPWVRPVRLSSALWCGHGGPLMMSGYKFQCVHIWFTFLFYVTLVHLVILRTDTA